MKINSEKSEMTFNLERLAETSNSLVLVTAANMLIENSAVTIQPSKEVTEKLLSLLDALEEMPAINAFAIEGVRGSGKTTQIGLLENGDFAVSGSRLITPLYTDFIQPQKKDVYMTMFGGEGRPTGSIIDSLIIAAFHADRLTRVQAISYNKPLLIDRHWLSFYAIERAKMIQSGLDAEIAENIVAKIVTTWNQVNLTLVLHNVLVAVGENRIIQRGEAVRSENEIQIETLVSETIELFCGGKSLIPKFNNTTKFFDAQKSAEVLHEEIKQYFIK